jgi:septal ring-binding cell division protein DamX
MAAELAYRNEDWLLAQSAERWMLQVATAGSEDAARAMLDRLGREKSAYYRTRRNGRVVFVVLAGSWGTREQALVGRDQLASEFRQLGPFAREMRAIHSEVIAVR